MGRPKKLAVATEEVVETNVEETVETIETVDEVVEKVNEEDIVEVAEVDETELPSDVTILDGVEVVTEQVSEDDTFVPGVPDGADPTDYVYEEPVVTVIEKIDAIKPQRLDALRHNNPRENVVKASKACGSLSSGVKISTKVAKLF